MENKELTLNFIKYLNTLQHVMPEDIPDIDLYMDQVLSFMETHLGETRRYESDKVLTKTMINNYAKNHLLPAPLNKKYGKEHILYLVYIYYLKNILSINDISTMFSLVEDISSGSAEFSDIYRNIVQLTKQEEIYRLMKDVTHKMSVSREAFSEEDAGDRDSRDRVRTFIYLCLLGFDVYLKKQLMERIIDQIRSGQTEDGGRKKEKSRKKTPESHS